ncbi:transglycosylase domain-containing protein, partial [Patescibacteria group bacterium]
MLAFLKNLFSKLGWKKILSFSLILLFMGFVFTYFAQKHIVSLYENQHPVVIKDRYGNNIATNPNSKEYYLEPLEQLPENFKDLLLKKEDRFFYYHLGVNPWSVVRAGIHYLFTRDILGSSTVTQQLTKILLGNEHERNLKNKIIETFYATSLELHQSKNDILTMYANSVHLGNQIQGFSEASQMYFSLPLELLNEQQQVQLLATISSPSVLNPWKFKNIKATKNLAEKFEIDIGQPTLAKKEQYSHRSPTYFELNSMGIDCEKTCITTIDQQLTEKLREILKRNIVS